MSKRKVRDSLINECPTNKARVVDTIKSNKRTRRDQAQSDNADKSQHEQESTLLCEFLKIKLNLLDKNEFNSTQMTEIISSIETKVGSNTRHTNLIKEIFSKMIKKNEFNENMFLTLLNQLNDEFILNQKELAELLLSYVYSIKIESTQLDENNNTIKPSTSSAAATAATSIQTQTNLINKKFKFKPPNYTDLIRQTFRLLNTTKNSMFSNRDLIYENIMSLFSNLVITNESYLKEKATFLRAKKLAIEKFQHDLAAENNGAYASKDFLKAFKKIIDKNSINSASSYFIFTLYLATVNNLNDAAIRKELNDVYFKSFEKYFHLTDLANKSEWINKCLKQKIDYKNFIGLFKYNNLIQFINQTTLINGLIDFCLIVLETYGVEINKFMIKPDTLNEQFTFLVYKILEDIFPKSKNGREKILVEFLNRAIESENRAVYIAQLELILNSKSTLKVFYGASENKQEVELFEQIIISKLTGVNCISSNSSSTSVKSSNKKSSILDIENCDDVLKLLDVFRMFYFTSTKLENKHLDNLINLFKSNASNDSIKTREKALYGLITLLNALNKDHFQYHISYDRNEFTLIRELGPFLDANLRTSIDIIELIKQAISKNEQEASIKSKIYQSLFNTLKNNNNGRLIDPIAQIFLKQIEKYLIRCKKTGLIYFDLDKCISIDEFKLTEPIDVLVHCADLYSSTGIKMVNANTAASKTLDSIKTIINELKKVYIDKDSKFLYEIYKSQLIDKVQVQTTPAFCMKIIHQIELGLIDVLLEHCVQNESFSEITKILEKYDSTSNLISIEIENLMSSITLNKQAPVPPNNKRKLEVTFDTKASTAKLPKKSTNKKLKSSQNDSDKENQPTETSKSISKQTNKSLRSSLANISNTIKSSQHSSQQLEQRPSTSEAHKPSESTGLAVLKDLSLINIQFNHEHRISYKCCLRMIKIYLGAYDTSYLKKTKLNPNSLISIVALLANEKFVDFLLKVVDQKLKNLTSWFSANRSREIYDPQSKNDYQLFNFMSELWLSFCQRINGTLNDEKSIFKSQLSQRFATTYLTKTHGIIENSRIIWSIVSQHFQSLVYKMVKSERRYYSVNDYNSCYYDDDDNRNSIVTWNFLKNCTVTLKSFLNPLPSNQAISNDCCTSLLGLMYEIMLKINLTPENLDAVSHLLFELADRDVAENQKFGSLLIKIMNYVESKRATPALITKHIALNYRNYVYSIQDSDTEEEEEHDPIDEIKMECRLFTKNTNINEYIGIICDQLNQLFSQFKWCITSLKLFNKNKLLIVINNQLDYIVQTISYTFKSVSSFETAELNIKQMTRLYEFLSFYLQSELTLSLTENGLYVLSKLIERISTSLQSNMSDQLNKINDFIVANEKQKEGKANSEQILDIIKYKENMANLINSISCFEKQLKQLNDLKQDKFDLMTMYPSSVSNLSLNFSSKIIRIVSENEIDNILNSKQNL